MDKKLQKIEKYGGRYRKEILLASNKKLGITEKSIEDDWYAALNFFFGRSFYRGRKDELSTKFKNKTFEVLNDYRLKNRFPKFERGETFRFRAWSSISLGLVI